MPPARPEPARDSAAAEPSRATLRLAVVLGISLLWRLPSLFDPPWVNDEGTYFAMAQGISHGLLLYRQLWENKPPAIYMLFAAVYAVGGPSVLAIRLVAAAAVLAAVTLTVRLGTRFRSPATGVLAGMVAGLLLGAPVLEGTTANAETFAAPLAAGAVYLAFVRDRWAIGGLAIGSAILFKSVAAFDGAALGIWLLAYRRERVPTYFTGVLAPLLLTSLLAWRAGDLSALFRDAVLYDIGYVGQGNGGGVPWVLVVKVLLLAGATLPLLRRSFLAVWMLYALAGALFSGRLFGHYFVQAVIPFALIATPTVPWRRLPRAMACLAGVAILTAGLVTAGGALLERTRGSGILAWRLQYYGNVARFAAGSLNLAAYRGRLDDHVNRTLTIAAELRRLPPGRLLVWGNVPWLYPLSHRLPATIYTSSLRSPSVPGETATLRRALLDARPRVVVVIRPPRPGLGVAAAGLRAYRRVARVDDADIYAVRPPASRPAPARTTASAITGIR